MSGVKLQLTSKQKKIEKRNSNFDHEEFEETKKRKVEVNELVKEIEGSKIQSLLEKPEEKPLVIPLVNKNQYQKLTGETIKFVTEEEKEAVAAIIAETNGEVSTKEIAPILQQNRVPGLDQITDEGEKFKYDVNMRPDQASLEDYERIPIEQFGMAMLRGMGWNENMVVGKNQRKSKREPVVHKKRPHLLGLGAQPAPEPTNTKPSKKYIKPGEKREKPATPSSANGSDYHDRRKGYDHDEECIRKKDSSPELSSSSSLPNKDKLTTGNFVKIIEGKHTGKTGKVVEIKVKEQGTVVKLECPQHEDFLRVWKEDVILVEELASNTTNKSTNTSAQPKVSWLRPNLRVKIISKSFQGGRFYKTKGTIYDMLSPFEVIIKSNNGEMIEVVHQSMLETIIPSVNDHVMIVQSKDNELIGQTAKILEKSNSKELVAVQLDSNFSVHKLHFDDICDFVQMH